MIFYLLTRKANKNQLVCLQYVMYVLFAKQGEWMLTQQILEKYLWGAATLLRGLIDAGDYKQYIFPLLFFKRICDVYDEEYEIALK